MAHHQQFVTKKQKKEEEVEHVPLYCVVDGDAQKWSNLEEKHRKIVELFINYYWSMHHASNEDLLPSK